jgi:hypothetical protein
MITTPTQWTKILSHTLIKLHPVIFSISLNNLTQPRPCHLHQVSSIVSSPDTSLIVLDKLDKHSSQLKKLTNVHRRCKRGAELYVQQCEQCHTLEKGAPHVFGPNLYSIFGQVSGQIPGSKPSQIYKDKAITWTPGTMVQCQENSTLGIES